MSNLSHLDHFIDRIESDPAYLNRLLHAIAETDSLGADLPAAPAPLVSIGPSGIGGYAQKEVMP